MTDKTLLLFESSYKLINSGDCAIEDLVVNKGEVKVKVSCWILYDRPEVGNSEINS